ncbi:MAG: Fe2+-dependent dioxygenase [Rhodospirillales bacterium]
MLYRLPRLLTREELASLRIIAARCTFADGRSTAGDLVRDVKNNRQVDDAGEDQAIIDRIVLGALGRNPVFQYAVLPRAVRRPFLNAYRDGETYGMHVDNPILSGRTPLRTDVSVTVFLSEPASYDGGELIVELPGGTATIKMDAGDAVAYSGRRLHRVAPVTRGERLAAITWAQSLVADEAQREALYDLHVAMSGVAAKLPGSPEADLLFKTYANLVRSWSAV